MKQEFVICGVTAYPNTGGPGYPIRHWRGKYQAKINGRWRNIKVTFFMDWDPLWKY